MRAVRDPDPFIFCLDNGAAYVSTGLLARLQNDSQLAMLLAPELSSVLAPDNSVQQEYDAKVRRQAGPKLLAVIATAGLAAFPMMSSENKAYDAHLEAVILANDKVGLDWARRAGFDPAQASAAAQRLAAVLEKEGHGRGQQGIRSLPLVEMSSRERNAAHYAHRTLSEYRNLGAHRRREDDHDRAHSFLHGRLSQDR